jgi:tRNA(Ile)-lysidine synthase
VPTLNVLADEPRRFAADVAALTGGALSGRFGVAISGGPDSLALLLLAQSVFGDRVEAATVDHGLRTASQSEAAHVADICARHGIRHETLVLRGLRRGNLSAAAREARYAALTVWLETRKLDWLMTGHHADDQLETFVMRLNRSSGVGGLSGVRRRSGRLLRPLLGWRRFELQAVVDTSGERAIDDPTNRDDRFDRARLRKVLADAEWIDPIAVARSASALAEADEALDWTVAQLRGSRLRQGGADWTYDARGLPAELRRRALVDCVRRFEPRAAPRGTTIDRALAALTAGKTATIGTLRCASVDDRWTISKLPPRRPVR